MTVYYNEFDPYAAAWLRNLITAGHLPHGDVDERDIREVTANDVKGYTQAHFFAGIGGWPLALRLAGWPDDRPVWTGSCPCQPFSSAGKQEGHGEERHLWPDWFRLIRECRPSTVFGEQVASAIAFGWLDEVFNDLEAEAYSCAPAVLPACSIGAPHRRERLWFVADSDANRRNKASITESHDEEHHAEPCGFLGDAEFNGRAGRPITGSDGKNDDGRRTQGAISAVEFAGTGEPGNVPDAASAGLYAAASPGIYCGEESTGTRDVESKRPCFNVGVTERKGLERFTKHDENRGGGRIRMDQLPRQIPVAYAERLGRCGGNSEGENAENANAPGEGSIEWVECPDGKARPIKPGIRLLANGVPARVGKLRAYGNAIVPQVAAEFIKAFLEVEQ